MGNEEMAQERTMTSAATASQKATETKRGENGKTPQKVQRDGWKNL